MKHAVQISATLLILLLVIQPYYPTQANSISALQQWLERIRRQIMSWRPTKRECEGYMCSYSHISSSASAKAKHSALMKFLYSCATNPNCQQGKRRKRSTWSVGQSSDPSRRSSFLHLLQKSMTKS